MTLLLVAAVLAGSFSPAPTLATASLGTPPAIRSTQALNILPAPRFGTAAFAAIPMDSGTMYWYNMPGQRTACGQRFDPSQRTIAHRWLPCGTRVQVVTTYGAVEAVVNDRGPWCRSQRTAARRGVPWKTVARWPCSMVADASPAVRDAVMRGHGRVNAQIVVLPNPAASQ